MRGAGLPNNSSASIWVQTTTAFARARLAKAVCDPYMAFCNDCHRQPRPIFALKSKFPNHLVVGSRQFPALREKPAPSSSRKPKLGVLNCVSAGSAPHFKPIPFAPSGSDAAALDPRISRNERRNQRLRRRYRFKLLGDGKNSTEKCP